MPLLMMAFLAVVCLYGPYPAPLWGGTPLRSAWLTGAVLALVGLHAFYVSRRISRPLARAPEQRDRLLPRYERGRYVHQFVLFGAYALALGLLGWGWAVHQFWADGGRDRPGVEVLLLAPFLLGQVLSWLFFYDADRAAYQASRDLLNEESPAPGGRWAYVIFQLRQKMALLFIPIALLVLMKEAMRQLPAEWQEWQLAVNALGGAGLLCIFIGLPWIVRLALGLKPLPPGVLRDRLFAIARRLDFRFSDVLLWNTRNGMANALVVGIVPWVRYVVFTDRLIEEFPEEEVEAVFGHEIGHVKHHHMPYYFAFLTGSMIALGLLADDFLLKPLQETVAPLLQAAEQAPEDETVQAAPPPKGEAPTVSGPTREQVIEGLTIFPVVGGLLVYVFAFFGFLSRRCERQADVYGCRVASCGDPACRDHADGREVASGAGSLCPTGIRTFIQALEKVADVNGISRDRPGFLQSWQHSTIGRRVAFLQKMLDDPTVEPAFQRRLARTKWALFLGLGAALAVLLSIHGWPF